MNNEQMTYADLKLLEKDLHRELTDSEAAYGYAFGWKSLLERIGLDNDKYVAYRRLLELVITYCTKGQIELEKLRSSKDYTSAFELLGDFINACEVELPTGGFEFDQDTDDEEDEEDNKNIFDLNTIISMIIDAVPNSETEWLIKYTDLDPNLEVISKYISDLYHDDEPHNVDETVGDVVDLIKDTVVERLVARLSIGEEMTLNDDILDEVMEYIGENWTNYSMKVVNNTIKCKKF